MKITKKIIKTINSLLIMTVLLSCFGKENKSHEQPNGYKQLEVLVPETEDKKEKISIDEPVKKYVSDRYKPPNPDINFLVEMPELEEVDIAINNLLTDISPLSTLLQLKRLSLSYVPNIQSIQPLANLINLEYLYLDFKIPTDGAALNNLQKLKRLNLCYTKLTTIHYIANLSNLEILFLYVYDSNTKKISGCLSTAAGQVPHPIYNFNIPHSP